MRSGGDGGGDQIVEWIKVEFVDGGGRQFESEGGESGVLMVLVLFQHLVLWASLLHAISFCALQGMTNSVSDTLVTYEG